MRASLRSFGCVVSLACAGLAGCRLPGRNAADTTPLRPDQVTDFAMLYSNNCAACHGENGQHGTSISLANPVYLAYAGEANIAKATANGVPGSLMPAFAKESGGLLTDAQVQILAHGMVTRWGRPDALHGATPPPYTSTATGDPARGEAAYRQECLRCHNAGPGNLLDPTYLALITNQGLRSVIVAGKPTQGMPDWTGYGGAPLTDGDVADLVAFLAAHRTSTPGQPYSGPAQGNPPGTQDKSKPASHPAQEKVSN